MTCARVGRILAVKGPIRGGRGASRLGCWVPTPSRGRGGPSPVLSRVNITERRRPLNPDGTRRSEPAMTKSSSRISLKTVGLLLLLSGVFVALSSGAAQATGVGPTDIEVKKTATVTGT